jgi:peptide/nickel transport system substrate-binding protein
MTRTTNRSGLTRRQLIEGGAAGMLAFAGAPLIAGCGGGSSASPATTAAGSPARGGDLTVALITGGQAETIAVPSLVNTPDLLRGPQLWDPLFTSRDEKGVVPWLAESGEPNADATVWTIALRDGVTWHDGKPLTADDLLYTIRSWGDSTSYFNSVAATLIDFKGVRKRGKLVVEVPLIRPVADFPSVTVYPNALVIQDGTTDFNRPVGTGPFKFESFTPGQRSVFVRNENYWVEGEPYVDRLIIDSSFADENARINAQLGGFADIVPTLSFAAAKQHQDSGAIRVSRSAGPSFQAIYWRVDKAPFTDPRVGQALKMLVDRKAMVDTVYNGFGTIGNDCGVTIDPYFADSIKPTYDPEQARSLLKAAGRENLSVTLTTGPYVAGFTEASTLFVEQAKRAGVTVNLNRVPASEIFDPAAGYYSYPMAQTYWYTLPSLTSFYMSALHQKAPIGETHWGDATTDDVLFEALAAIEPAEAERKWLAVQQLQAERGGYLIFGQQDYIDGYSPRVQGIKATPAGWANNFDFKSAWIKA